MQREPERLNGSFDLLVIGGGIYGAWIAYDAALRGLGVALVEKDDWAAGTSSASSKLIHGGLRYLEHRHLGLVRKSLLERHRLARLGPHRVWPLRFLLPLYRGARHGRLRMRFGLWLYDRLGGRDPLVGGHENLGRDELLRRCALLETDGLLGGFTYGDCGTDDARFTLEIVDGALTAGAVAANRVEVTRLLRDGPRITGAEVRDRETGRTADVRAACTISCAGPWNERLTGAIRDTTSRVRHTRGVHLVMPALETEDAFLLTSEEDRRVVFLIPWYGRTLLGTTDTDYTGDPDDVRVEAGDVAYLLSQVHRHLRGPRWTEDDIQGRFAGLRTLPATGASSPSDVSREWLLDEPAPGLLASVGGKYTSARQDAAQAVDRVERSLGRRPASCPTAERPFPWAPEGDFEVWTREMFERGTAAGLDEATSRLSLSRYGSRASLLHALLGERPDLARRVVESAAFCRGELVLAARDEMARTLADVLRRRVPLQLLTRLPESVLADAADLVGQPLGWSESRRREEIASLLPRTGPSPAGREAV